MGACHYVSQIPFKYHWAAWCPPGLQKNWSTRIWCFWVCYINCHCGLQWSNKKNRKKQKLFTLVNAACHLGVAKYSYFFHAKGHFARLDKNWSKPPIKIFIDQKRYFRVTYQQCNQMYAKRARNDAYVAYQIHGLSGDDGRYTDMKNKLLAGLVFN